MNEFDDRFKDYSPEQLLAIADSTTGYQPLAVEAARRLLASRQLPDEELAVLWEALAAQRQADETNRPKPRVLPPQVNELGVSLAQAVGQIHPFIPTTDRVINLISVLVGLGCVINWADYAALTQTLLTDFVGILQYYPALIFHALLLVAPPLSAWLFYRRQKIGWTLLAINFTLGATGITALLLITLYSEVPDALAAQVLGIALSVGTLWAMGRPDVRAVYGIDRSDVVFTVSLAVLAAILVVSGWVAMQ